MTTQYYKMNNGIFDKIDTLENGSKFLTRVIRYSNQYEVRKETYNSYKVGQDFKECSKAIFMEKLNEVVEFFKNELFQESFK